MNDIQTLYLWNEQLHVVRHDGNEVNNVQLSLHKSFLKNKGIMLGPEYYHGLTPFSFALGVEN